MSESNEKKATEETIQDLEPQQDPKGGIIAVLIGLQNPTAPPIQNPGVIRGFNPQPDPPKVG